MVTNNKKVVRTNERCYICDFQRGMTEDEHPKTDSQVVGVFQNGLTRLYQDERGRFVYIDPRDDRPICTQCSKAARDAVKELEWIDRDYQPQSLRENLRDLFKTWEDILIEDAKRDKDRHKRSSPRQSALGAENKEEMELATT